MVFRTRRKIIPAKTPGELDAMQAAGEVVGKALQAVKAAATAGVSTLDLDKVAEDVIRSAGDHLRADVAAQGLGVFHRLGPG